MRSYVKLANKIWSVAYSNYPYKVLWHDGCQGYFEIWKELETNNFTYNVTNVHYNFYP